MFGFFISLRYYSTFLLASDIAAILPLVKGTTISVLGSLDAGALAIDFDLLRRLSLRIN